MKFTLPKIYPITDRKLSGLPHEEQVIKLASGGASLIQLRAKSENMRTFYEDARRAVERADGALVLVNDRVDIAVMAGAAGVHLGQDDLPPEEARRLLGPEAIIGFSTHSVEQAIRAVELPIDYIAIGPIFATATKTDTEPVVGLDGIRAVRRAIGDFPLVAIGGIGGEHLRSVFKAGADSAAMIAGLHRSNIDLAASYRELSAKL